jgi:hypothetical protein
MDSKANSLKDHWFTFTYNFTWYFIVSTVKNIKVWIVLPNPCFGYCLERLREFWKWQKTKCFEQHDRFAAEQRNSKTVDNIIIVLVFYHFQNSCKRSRLNPKRRLNKTFHTIVFSTLKLQITTKKQEFFDDVVLPSISYFVKLFEKRSFYLEPANPK